MPRVVVDETRCKGCERCIEACPQGVIALSKSFNEKGYFFAMPSEQPRCIGCRLCAINCPDVAIEIFVNGTLYQFVEY